MVLERSRIEQPMTHGRNGSVIRSCARTSFRGIPTKRDMTSFGSVGGSHWIKVVPWMVLKSYGICFNGLEERLREFSFFNYTYTFIEGSLIPSLPGSIRQSLWEKHSNWIGIFWEVRALLSKTKRFSCFETLILVISW